MSTKTRSASDIDLLGEVRDGRAGAFEAVYRQHYPTVLAFVARRVTNPEVAADLLAETFAALLALVRDPSRPLPPNPIAWLLLTARHLMIDSRRRGRVEDAARRRLQMQPVLVGDSDLERIEEAMSETALLERLAEQLSPDELQALRASV